MDGERYHAHTNQEKAGVAILISDREDFKAKKVIRDEEWYFVMKRLIPQEDITILSVYVPTTSSQDIMQKQHARKNRLTY